MLDALMPMRRSLGVVERRMPRAFDAARRAHEAKMHLVCLGVAGCLDDNRTSHDYCRAPMYVVGTVATT